MDPLALKKRTTGRKTHWDLVFPALLFLFFSAFLFYPIGYVLTGALGLEKGWRWGFLALAWTDRAFRPVATKALATGEAAVALAWAINRILVRFGSRRIVGGGKAFYGALALLPVVLPPLLAALVAKGLTFELFSLLWRSPTYKTALLNSLGIALCVVTITSVLAVALALPMSRYRFAGKATFSALMLAPLIMPPFVGAIGVRQFLTRYGSLNLLLMRLGLISQRNPIDWLGEYRFWGVVALESLHLYPILYLNVLAALTNLDATLEEAAQNLGARGWRLLRDITFPLTLPGYFAGAIIVFIWAFTDLGTPLIFGYREVLPIKIFDLVNEAESNPVGYALVLTMLLLTAAVFVVSRHLARVSAATGGGGAPRSRERKAGPLATAAIYALAIGITSAALIPHFGVLLKSTAAQWSISILPEKYTLRYYGLVFHHPISLSSIRISLLLSILSTGADLALGFLIAYYIMRKTVRGRALLDIMAMLPLALPGIILAFGYVTCFAGVPLLDPRRNPIILLIVGYTVRRLPFTVRAAVAGFQQTNVAYEEASANLGARPLTTMRRISIPLIFPHLVAGGILAFAFAMLEVSESLMLAFRRQYYPIAKAIYTMVGRIDDGPFIASAMGMLGMGLLLVCFIAASRFLGRRLGEVFRF